MLRRVTMLIAIALVSAALHAGWNALLKREQDVSAASVVVIFGAATISGALALAVGPAQVPQVAWPAVLAAGVVEGVYFVSLAGALTRLPLQAAYGLSRGLGLLLVWPVSMYWFGERATLLRALGAAALALGLFALIQRGGQRAGLLFAVLAALTISAYPVAYKNALALGVAPYSLFALSLFLGLPAALLAMGRSAPARVLAAARAGGVRLPFAASICAASFLLFLHALNTLGPAHLTALRNTSVLFASLYAWGLGERVTPRSLAAAALMALGGVLVSL